MPLVTISLLKGRTGGEVQKLSEAIHEAMVLSLEIPDAEINQRIQEFERRQWRLPAEKSNHYVLIEMDLFTGRSQGQKDKLYAELVSRLGAFQVPPEDVMILLRETAPNNWGVRGGIAAGKVYPGMEVNV